MAKKSGSQYKIYPPSSRVLRLGIAVCLQGGVENGDKGGRRPRGRSLIEFCIVGGHDMTDRASARVKYLHIYRMVFLIPVSDNYRY